MFYRFFLRFSLSQTSSLAAFLFLLNSSSAADPESDIKSKMISNGIRSILDVYHGNDWEILNNQANQYWRDPTEQLSTTLDEQISKLTSFLDATFLGNENAVKKILENYFTEQCEKLYEDYNKTNTQSFSYLRSFPTQYTTTLTYESKAIELGIRLQQNFHQLYSLTHQLDDIRAKKIEIENNKIPVFSPPPVENLPKKSPPPPPINVMKSPAKGYDPKAVKKTPQLPTIPEHVKGFLDDIRMGKFTLKHVDPKSIGSYKDPNSLSEILKRGLEKIERNVHHGEEKSPRETNW